MKNFNEKNGYKINKIRYEIRLGASSLETERRIVFNNKQICSPGEYFLIWLIQGCAAGQGMVLAPLS